MLLEIPAEDSEYLQRAAARDGLTLEAYVLAVVRREARRLFYVERSSQRRERKEPPDVLVTRLSNRLLAIYQRLRERLGETDFQLAYGDQLAEVHKWTELRNAVMLANMLTEQPWNRRG